jgi:glutathione S-transferase
MSGQGPYYGQASWFGYFHPTKIPPAIERYMTEVRRVLGVLETVLSEKPADARWLVGDKMTFADMAFVSWNFRLSELLAVPWDEVWKDIPSVRAWHERMVELPAWKRAMEHRARLMDEQGLQWNGMPKGVESFTDYQAAIAASKDTTAKEST